MAGAWDVIAGVLGFGPSGNDHGSSNWAAWGHEEIRSMLDHTVDPTDIYETAAAWRDQGRNTAHVLTGFTQDLNGIVTGGWRGAAADAALTTLGPINQWAASHAETAEHITRLMEDSGSAAAQAKASVPPPKSHSWMESLAVTTLTGPAGGIVDAVWQEQQQANAHAEAVQIMNNVYSAPINDHRAAVPTYPQLADPTLAPPEQPPTTGPAPGTLYSAPSTPHAGAGLHGGAQLSQPPTAAALQGVTSSGGANPVPHTGSPMTSDQAIRPPQYSAIAAAGTPIATEGANRRPPVTGTRPVGPQLGGGRTAAGPHPGGGARLGGGLVRAGGGHHNDFGPRPSSAAVESAEGRAGGLGRAGAAAAGRAGPGAMMPPMAAGRGKGGEDSEHRRPSYLIEMDDIFVDGRKVAPAVIGEDPPGRDGS